MPKELWVIAVYYNPIDYSTRLYNFERFKAEMLKSGVPLLTVQCLAPSQKPAPTNRDFVLTVRADCTLWQKERLLNLGLSKLPDGCDAVAWIDCDVVFDDPGWPNHALRLLSQYPVIQLFSEIAWLERGQCEPTFFSERMPSFAARLAEDSSVATANFSIHGHTGFAWAARREILEQCGFFDKCIVGGADHAMAHVFAGNWKTPCIDRLFSNGSALRGEFEAWSQVTHAAVGGSVGARVGRIFHLWHGSTINRQYLSRHAELDAFSYSPASDLSLNPDGCWMWKQPGSALANYVENYFIARREDDQD